MSHKILVIEDNVEMADNISGILQLASYTVIHAGNGRMGVDLAHRHRPDLILCDIMMPELDGYGVLHILSKDPDTMDIPFIFLTAKADKSDFRTGMNLGADDYITKPFDGVDLLKVVEMRLRKSDSRSTIRGDLDSLFNKVREQKDFERLVENRKIRSFKRKEIVYQEGQPPNDLYFVDKGKVKTYKANGDGKELITSIIHESEFFGFMPLLEEKSYQETAEALEDSQISIIPKSDFIALMYTSKDVARAFIKLLSNSLCEMENRLLDVAYQSVRQRVANVLLKMSETAGDKKDGLITILRKDISSFVGTAAETLNRTLADFREEGLIETVGEGLRIIDRQKLQKAAH
jgi:CRP-like cAMP-binding protein